MKKQLLLSAVALFSVVGVSAQLATITQEWKTPVGDATNMRQGTYANGKFYIQNKNDGTVDVWTKDGKESTLTSTQGSMGICADDAGNIIVQNESGTFGTQTGDSRPIRIYPAAGGEAVDITLILPSMGVTCGRSDFFGKASGNVLSEEGGTFYLLCANSPYVYILPIKNGAQDVDNMNAVDVSVAFENSNDGTLKGTASTQTIAYEYDGDIIIHERKCGVKRMHIEEDGNATKVKDYTIVPLKEETESMTCFPTDMVGSCFFTIGDEDYLVYSWRYYSTEVAYESGFAVLRLSDEEKVAEMKSQGTNILANPAFGQWFAAVPVSDTQAEIYHYFPAAGANNAFISKYIFDLASSSVEGVETTTAKVVANHGEINVIGNANSVEVYNVGGILISKDEMNVKCNAGIYLVKVDGKVSKVIVR